MLNKKGMESTTVFIWVIGIAILLYLNSIGTFGTTFGASVATPQQTQAQQEIITAASCPDPSNTMTFGTVTKKWSPTTTISASAGTSIRYYINDGTGTTTTSSSTTTVGYKDKIEGLYSYGSSADSTYYQQKFDLVAPCRPFFTKEFSNAELIANGTVTFDVFNSDTGNKNAGDGADNETINTGETGKFTIKLSTADKTGISTPGGKYMLALEMNKSMYDEATVTLGGKPGIAVPQSYTLGATDNYAIGWEFPACPIGDARRCDDNLGTLYIAADSSENPTGVGLQTAASVSLGDLKLTVLDQSYGVNTVTDAIIGPAYVNDVGTALGLFTSTGQSAYITVD